MNSVPQHLRTEDRQEYERILDEVLRSAPHRPELAAVGRHLTSEQLRTMALNATALITAAAAIEYQHYVKVREEMRRPARSAPSPTDEEDTSDQGTGATGTAVEEAPEAAGPGVVAVVAVLAPVLAATAATIFLLVGYLLKMFDPAPAVARPILTTGWVFGAVAAATILVAAVGLLLTALHNRPALDAGSYGELSEEVHRAREAWGEALLEHGILPFLREALAEPDPDNGVVHGPTSES